MFLSASPAVRAVAWIMIVAATAWFFAYAETFFYIQPDAASSVWYIDKDRMLAIGSLCYALYFIVSFPNVYRLDEPPGEKWNLSRCVVEAGFVSMASLFLIDLFAWVYGPIV
jgi:cycloeucalenol cycloisomerase